MNDDSNLKQNIFLDLIGVCPNITHLDFPYMKDFKEEYLIEQLIMKMTNLEFINIDADIVGFGDKDLIKLSNFPKLHSIAINGDDERLGNDYLYELLKNMKKLVYLKVEDLAIKYDNVSGEAINDKYAEYCLYNFR